MTDHVRDNRARYNTLARAYDPLIRFGGLGQFGRFYRETALELDHVPGGIIIDVGCGPAIQTPYLLPRVWPDGSVIGVDIADKMVARAKDTATKRRWDGAEFSNGDAKQYSPPSPVDGVVFSLSLSTMEDPLAMLERAASWLKPGGRLVVFDSIPDNSRLLAKLLIYLKAPLVGAGPTAAPIEFVSDRLEDGRIRHFYLGVYTLISGRKPDESI